MKNGPSFESDEESLAWLLGVLPPAPPAWAEAAAALPQMRRDADRIIALAEVDQAFRAAVMADLEAALREAGYEPDPRLLAAVRARITRP